MPEIFDQNHDWIGFLLSKEANELHLFTFFALVKRRAGPLLNLLCFPNQNLTFPYQLNLA